ncbi:hypothetical protein G6K93_07570 [Agrobacterium rhizogenes]|nr:hypothetical protein [Rhizobium rhizogenes]
MNISSFSVGILLGFIAGFIAGVMGGSLVTNDRIKAGYFEYQGHAYRVTEISQ